MLRRNDVSDNRSCAVPYLNWEPQERRSSRIVLGHFIVTMVTVAEWQGHDQVGMV